MTHLRGITRDGVEDLEGRNQLLGTVDLDLDTTAGHLTDELGEVVGTGTQGGEVFRPGGYHLPFAGLVVLGLDRRSGEDGTTGDGPGAQLFDKLTSFHGIGILLMVVGKAFSFSGACHPNGMRGAFHYRHR